MITFEDAKKIALKHNPKVDACVEYETAWEFDWKTAPLSVGGMEGPVVVMKDTGEVVGLTWFLLHADSKRYIDPVEDVIRKFDL